MPINRKTQTAGPDTYYRNIKNRYNDPRKIDFRQGRINEIKKVEKERTRDEGSTMSMEPDEKSGARPIINRRKNVQQYKKSIDQLLRKKK